MKNYILILISILFVSLTLQAQVPQKFNYQGIARDSNGGPLASQNLGLQISILSGTTPVYRETHNVTTNNFGLYTLAVGDGTPVLGSMSNVSWSMGNKFIKVEIDPNGGTNYSNLGTTELLSVPYAIHAGSSGSNSGGGGGGNPTGPAGGDLSGFYPNPTIANQAITTLKLEDGAVTAAKLDAMGATNGQVLKFDGTTWTPENIAASTGDDWGTQIAETDVTLNGDGTIANPLGVADAAITSEKLHQMGATANQVLKWNGTNWIPSDEISDNWGTQVVETDTSFNGDGTTTSPLSLADGAITSPKLAAMGATNGQVLKFNGTNWLPGDDNEGATGVTYTAGDGISISATDEISSVLGTDIETSELQDAAVTSPKIADDAITTAKLTDEAITSPKLAAMGATNGQVLKFDGTNWLPSDEIVAAGDDWGTQVAETDATLVGEGTTADPLGLADNAVTTSKVADGAITSDKLIDAAITSEKLTNNAVTTAKIADAAVTSDKLNQMGATDDQILKWNGTNWNPADEVSGDDWGTQAAETDATIDGDGTTTDPLGLADNAVTTAKLADAAVTSDKLAQMNATDGQILSWDDANSAWTPTDETDTAFFTADADQITFADTDDFGKDFLVNTDEVDYTNTSSDPEYKMLFLPSKEGAFRVGDVLGDFWNLNNIGNASIAMGRNTKASGDFSTAMGWHTVASGLVSTAMGVQTEASGESSTAMGYFSEASGLVSTAIGQQTKASGPNSTAMGRNTEASGSSSTAMGWGTVASGNYSTAMGFQTEASGTSSIAMGAYTEASGNYSTAMGQNSKALANNSTVIGKNIQLNSTATGSMFLGDGFRDTNNAVSKGISNRFYGVFDNGYFLFTNGTLQNDYGVGLGHNASSWSTISDRNKKENIKIADGKYFIESIKNMELGSWNYIGQDSTTYRHWGPMAQDFHKYFGHDGIGTIGTDTTIATADIDGVMMIAIKALAEENDALKDEITQLKQEIKAKEQVFEAKMEAYNNATEEMEKRLSRMEALIQRSEPVYSEL